MRALIEKIRPNAIGVIVAFVALEVVALFKFIDLIRELAVREPAALETLGLGVVLIVLITPLAALVALAGQLSTDPEPNPIIEYERVRQQDGDALVSTIADVVAAAIEARLAVVEHEDEE